VRGGGVLPERRRRDRNETVLKVKALEDTEVASSTRRKCLSPTAIGSE
jgi:hypothetical protein